MTAFHVVRDHRCRKGGLKNRGDGRGSTGVEVEESSGQTVSTGLKDESTGSSPALLRRGAGARPKGGGARWRSHGAAREACREGAEVREGSKRNPRRVKPEEMKRRARPPASWTAADTPLSPIHRIRRDRQSRSARRLAGTFLRDFEDSNMPASPLKVRCSGPHSSKENVGAQPTLDRVQSGTLGVQAFGSGWVFHSPLAAYYWDRSTTGKEDYRDASAIMRGARQRLCVKRASRRGEGVSVYAWKTRVFRRVFRTAGSQVGSLGT